MINNNYDLNVTHLVGNTNWWIYQVEDLIEGYVVRWVIRCLMMLIIKKIIKRKRTEAIINKWIRAIQTKEEFQYAHIFLRLKQKEKSKRKEGVLVV